LSSKLIEFVGRALAKGLERDEIAQTLKAAGWPPTDIAAALNSFAEIDFPLPVPRPSPQVTAREVFTQLLFFTSLYASVWAFVAIIFAFIDHFLPDPLRMRNEVFDDEKYIIETIRVQISTLAVFFPLFLFMFRLDNRTAADPARRASRVHRWFVYLTLFAAAVTFACDASTLIYNLLGGELTAPFLLKILTVGIVASGIFTYFLHDARQREQESAVPK
jgi:hypothetical protein